MESTNNEVGKKLSAFEYLCIIYRMYVIKLDDFFIRLADVFKRQLSVPLFGMENTYSEYQEWAKTLPDGLVDTKTVEWSYKKALGLLETYKPFEERILSAESSELAEIYREYIKLTQKDPSTVICLYERALVDLCLSPEIWSEYCGFLFNLGDTAVKVSARALRNCPWSEDLWIVRLRILEKQATEQSEILNCFELGKYEGYIKQEGF